MISYFDSLSTLEDNFTNFSDWVLYLNNELIQHLPDQKDRISVLKVVLKKEYDDIIFDSLSSMKKYTNKDTTQYKGDSVYSNIRNIDWIFINLKAHENKFIVEDVIEIFKQHGVSWNKKQFKLLKESNNVAISMLQSYFEKHLPDYFSSSKEYLSAENRNHLLKYVKTKFINDIVKSILENEPLIIEVNPVTIEQKHRKTKSNLVKSFTIDFKKHKKFGKVNKELLDYEINESINDMMIKLISFGYLLETTKTHQFRKIFAGVIVKEKIKWQGKKNQLSYFISELYKNKLEKVDGNKKWITASHCFDIGEEVEDFSASIRKAGQTISATQKNQLNICISEIKHI